MRVRACACVCMCVSTNTLLISFSVTEVYLSLFMKSAIEFALGLWPRETLIGGDLGLRGYSPVLQAYLHILTTWTENS